MNVLSSVYGAAASWRRRWYARDASRVRRLGQPVVSVGNLRTGGSGKTPVVAHLARVLLQHGERPAILSRGYGRARPTKGVTVVSDTTHVIGDLDTSGDEPLMLARALPGVPVLVGADRFVSGRLAERQFHSTVHILDDGFQHLPLARDVDLLLVDDDDLVDRVLPAGRLREPLTNARVADAVLTPGTELADATRVASALHVGRAFVITRSIATPKSVRRPFDLPAGARVFAFAGIAKPARFFSDLAQAGWQVGGTLEFRDHYAFSQQDVDNIAARARAAGAAAILTTEKDAVRLERLDLKDVSIAAVPLVATVEPAGEFAVWLVSRLHRAS